MWISQWLWAPASLHSGAAHCATPTEQERQTLSKRWESSCAVARATSSRVRFCRPWLRAAGTFTLKNEAIMIETPISKPRQNTPAEEPAVAIDTSKMSSGQRAALELTEAAREAAKEPTFASGLFMGRFDASQIRPFPAQTAEDRDQGDAFLQQLERLLQTKVDPDEIDRTGEIPDEVIDELAKLRAFGIKVAPEYGGL